jgi:hypothetical protein
MADTTQPPADVSPQPKKAKMTELSLSPVHQHVYSLLVAHSSQHLVSVDTSRTLQDLLRLSANIVTLAKLNCSGRLQPEHIFILCMESGENTEEGTALVILHDYAVEPTERSNYRILVDVSSPAAVSEIIGVISAAVESSLRNWYLQHIRVKSPENSVASTSGLDSVSSQQHNTVLKEQKATIPPQDASKSAEKDTSGPTDPKVSDIEYDDSKLMKQIPTKSQEMALKAPIKPGGSKLDPSISFRQDY